MHKGFLAAALGAALALTPAAAWAQAIKLGILISKTGPASFLGEPQDKTFKLYVDKINSEGGVLGRKIELVQYDDGGDANAARTFATRLVEDDKVVAVIGGSTSGVSLAVLPVFEEAKVPFLSLAGAIEVIEPVRKFTFKTPHTDKMACEKIFADLKTRQLTKIAMLSGTDGFGKSMRAQCGKVAPTYGVQIIADESFGARDSDMTPQLTKIRGVQGVQAVVTAGFGQALSILTRNYAQLGIAVPHYQSHGAASKSYIEVAGPATEKVRLPGPALLVADQLPANDPQKAVVMAYKQAYEKATGQPVSTFGGYGFDALMLFVDAVKRAGGPDPIKIRDQLEATKGFVGVTGVFNFSDRDHMGLDESAFRLIEIRNGDWGLLAPAG